MKHLAVLYFAVLILFGATISVSAAESNTGSNKEEKFQAGKYIIHHISDSHEWHIMSIGELDMTIPLPVMVYSKTKGFSAFWSSKFEHGETSYNGFKIESEGTHEGSIVEVLPDGKTTDPKAELPFDLSITKTVAGLFFNTILLIIFGIWAGRLAKKNKGKAPSSIQNVFEPLIVFIREDIAKPSIGPKYDRYMPILITFFFFILLNNLCGLIPLFPFGANVTGNISITLVLAMITFVISTFTGNKNYWKEIFNPGVPMWMKFPVPFFPFIEFLSMIIRPIVLMIRLFANMMAGHMVVAIFIGIIFIFSKGYGAIVGYAVSPISVFFSLFMVLLDVLISIIQAYVFTLLSALYFGMSIVENHEQHN
ncbi:MAG: F0F1 ATP synthase subunit A [Bacteroidota bacterium]|nr:F0F1 ATP synthase subunit A [Bacteroidota bacterium]